MTSIALLSNRVQQLANGREDIAQHRIQGLEVVECGGAEAGALCSSKWYFDVSLAHTTWVWLGVVINKGLSPNEQALQWALAAAFEHLAVKQVSAPRSWPLSQNMPWREIESYLRDVNHVPAIVFDKHLPADWAAKMWLQWLKNVELQLWQKRTTLLLTHKMVGQKHSKDDKKGGVVPRIHLWQQIFEALNRDPLLQHWGPGQLELKAIDDRWVVVGTKQQGKMNSVNDFLIGSWESQLLKLLPLLLPEQLKAERNCKIVAEVYGN